MLLLDCQIEIIIVPLELIDYQIGLILHMELLDCQIRLVILLLELIVCELWPINLLLEWLGS